MRSPICARGAAFFLATPATNRSKNPILDRVAQALSAHLEPGARLLVAVSGGADSVALAHLLKHLPFDVVLGHVDHRLRRASGADARFVQAMAERWALPFVRERVSVRAYARRRRLGLEEAARALRYAALERMARRHRCRAIVTAHHADDQAETVLFNVLRGAGPAGLAGMAACRPLGKRLLLRPLLGTWRRDLHAYARRERLRFREDPTNRDTAFARNRLRHKTLPSLSREFPGLAGRLVRMAEIFRQEESFWQATTAAKERCVVRREGRTVSVDLAGFLRYHEVLGRRILRSLLPGASHDDIMRLMALAAIPSQTARLSLSGGFLAFRKGQKLLIVAGVRKSHRGVYEQS